MWNPGDKLRCIESGGRAFGGVVEGQIYTVDRMGRGAERHLVFTREKDNGGYLTRRFELAGNEPVVNDNPRQEVVLWTIVYKIDGEIFSSGYENREKAEAAKRQMEDMPRIYTVLAMKKITTRI